MSTTDNHQLLHKHVLAVLDLRAEDAAKARRGLSAASLAALIAGACFVASLAGIAYGLFQILPALTAGSGASPSTGLHIGLILVGMLGVVVFRQLFPGIIKGLIERRSAHSHAAGQDRLRRIMAIHPAIHQSVKAHIDAGHPLLVEDLDRIEIETQGRTAA